MLAKIERVITIQNPLKAERIEVVLRDFHKTRLNLNKRGASINIVECVLNKSDILLSILDIEPTKRLHVSDRRSVRPIHIHKGEESLKAHLLGSTLRVVATAAKALTLGEVLNFFGSLLYALLKVRKDGEITRNHFVCGITLVHDHNHGPLDDILVVHRFANELQSICKGNLDGRNHRNFRDARISTRGCL